MYCFCSLKNRFEVKNHCSYGLIPNNNIIVLKWIFQRENSFNMILNSYKLQQDIKTVQIKEVFPKSQVLTPDSFF